MADERNPLFEQQLKEILDSGSTYIENDQPPEEKKDGDEATSHHASKPGKKIDAATMVRIIAVITVLVLLISFGIQMAYR